MEKTPPLLASKLLEHLLSGPNAEALSGDLNERYARDRSETRYWLDVVIAIALCVTRGIRMRPAMVIRSMIITVGALSIYVESTWWAYIWISRHGLYQWLLDKPPLLAGLWIFYGLPLHMTWFVGCFLIGRMVRALHRDFPATVLFAAVVAELPLAFHWAWPWWIHSLEMPSSFRLPLGLSFLIVLVGLPLSTFVGGLLNGSSRRPEHAYQPVVNVAKR